MERLLDLARASYRLRDDDNLYIGRIEAELHRSIREAKRRMDSCESGHEAAALANIIVETIREKDGSSISTKSKKEDTRFRALPRQLVGQPAGPGLAVGKARVIHTSSDLFDFQEGEALVCDAVDPNMTFIVPLCVGIVERRGGMLIHGAIIAREYGLPCVTGVPQATMAIRTGQTITIDGYLGIVTVGS